ncbi:Aldo/keto reductase [Mycena alexandri]|uniref:Aldo/keto reductase n=1 Tax=Mycena alexandri TaxID=1745969 RepID=A0AAD6S7C1_9AGAR|nr:Aldo/keto reductase [Mycena alexandri]
MTTTTKSALPVILGTLAVGAPEYAAQGARVNNVKDLEAIIEIFLKHGHHKIDTARVYGLGTAEKLIGAINWQQKGILIDTKLLPAHPLMPEVTGAHTFESLRKFLLVSLKALNTDKIDIWYLHGPDRSVPFEVTLKAIDDLYREGHFMRFGISNYMASEVAEMVVTCKERGYVQPSVFQGIYNAIHRLVEPELFHTLRKFNIAFYGFNPLAGGFFTDRYSSADANAEPGSRYDPDTLLGKPEFFAALAEVRTVATAHGLTMQEIAMRWVQGDAVIIGGSSVKHIEENLIDLEKGPLPEEVVTALDAAWAAVKGYSSDYHSPIGWSAREALKQT